MLVTFVTSAVAADTSKYCSLCRPGTSSGDRAQHTMCIYQASSYFTCFFLLWMVFRNAYVNRCCSWKFFVIYTEKYVVNCVEVWLKMQTQYLHEKKLVRHDGRFSDLAVSEQECRLFFQSAEITCICDHISVVCRLKCNTLDYYVTNWYWNLKTQQFFWM